MNSWRHISILLLLALPVLAIPSFAQDDEQCLACHSVPHGATPETEAPLINMSICQRSIHLEMGFACIDCHLDIDALPHKPDLAPVDCVMCHIDTDEVFAQSIHGQALAEGNEDAPTCARCHGSQNLLPSEDPGSPVNRLRLSRLCGECHSDATVMSKYGISSSEQEILYRGSVHAGEVAEGNENAPTCVECHGYHDTRPQRVPNSRTNFMNVPDTCGQCHEQERELYLSLIHI